MHGTRAINEKRAGVVFLMGFQIMFNGLTFRACYFLGDIPGKADQFQGIDGNGFMGSAAVGASPCACQFSAAPQLHSDTFCNTLIYRTVSVKEYREPRVNIFVPGKGKPFRLIVS
jgi:hypothetical protein